MLTCFRLEKHVKCILPGIKPSIESLASDLVLIIIPKVSQLNHILTDCIHNSCLSHSLLFRLHRSYPHGHLDVGAYAVTLERPLVPLA